MLARFYGWSDDDIVRLSSVKRMAYRKAITPLKSNEAMENAEWVTYPHLNKKEDRTKFWHKKKLIVKLAIERPRQGLKSYKEVAANLARTMKNG